MLDTDSHPAAALACPVCGKPARPTGQFDDVRLYRCEQCDQCFTDTAALRHVERYDDTYYAHTHEGWNQNPDLGLFRRIGALVRAHKADASVIDVGCGRGDLLQFLKRENPALRLTGIDLSPPASLPGVTVVKDDFTAHAFPERFDAVVSLQAIEHMGEIDSFVRKLRDVMADDGLAIISTVNDRSISYDAARFLRAAGWPVAYQRLYSRHHLQHFNVTSLTTLMERSGFTVRQVMRHNEPLFAVDMPPGSRLKRGLLRAGVAATFALGTLTGRTVLQTIVCTKRADRG